MRACFVFLNFGWIHHPRLRFPDASSTTSLFPFCNLLPFPRVFDGSSVSPSSGSMKSMPLSVRALSTFGFAKKRRLSVSERYRALVSPLPILAFPSSELLLTRWTTFQATKNQVWQLLGSSYRAPWTTCILKEVFFC